MTDSHECDCIVLAAGLSSRMSGSKMLRRIDGVPLVRLAVSHALAACARVIVVLGHEAGRVRGVLGEEGERSRTGRSDTGRLLFVENRGYRRGMFSSIQTGMREVSSEWFFVVPGDMPVLTPALFAAVAAAAGGGVPPRSPLAIVPYYRETRGHPVLVHRSLVPRLVDEPPEAGPMRRLLDRYPLKRLHIDDPAITVDLDTDDDMTAHLRGDHGRALRRGPRTPDA